MQKRNITYILNLYLTAGGEFPKHCQNTLSHALTAVGMAQSCDACLLVAVSRLDAQFFRKELEGREEKVLICELDNHSGMPPLSEILGCIGKTTLPSDRNSYVCYANADINIPFWFFDFLNLNLNVMGENAGIVVNRKDVLDGESDISEGVKNVRCKDHPGFDCMVFPEKMSLDFSLGDCTIGYPPVGALLVTNMLHILPSVKLINDCLITWHEGDGSASDWQEDHHREKIEENFMAAYLALDKLFFKTPSAAQFSVKTLTHSSQLIRQYINWKKRGAKFTS